MTIFRRFLLCSVAGPLAFGAAAAQTSAQTAPSATETGSFGVEEIVVTAQKRSQSLQDVPIAISVLSSTALETAGVTSTAKLAQITPNVTISVNSSFFQPFIRGVGTSYANFGLEPSVSLYLDDQYLPRGAGAVFSLNDISRIEVLKGPQGTLYGRNATGGAIRVISNDPVDTFEMNVNAGYGSYQEYNIGGVVNVPIVQDKVAGRLAVQYVDRGKGYIKRRFGGDSIGERDQLLARGKLLFNFTDTLSFKLSGDYIKSHDDTGTAWLSTGATAPQQLGIAVGGLPGRSFRETAQDYTADTVIKQYGVAGRLALELDTLTLSSVTTFRRAAYAAGVDLDATSAVFLNGYQIDVTKNYSQEFQAGSSGNGPLTWIAGVYLYREEGNSFFEVFGPAVAGTGQTVRLGTSGVIKSAAVYADATYEIVPRFSVTLGARQTHESKDVDQNTSLTNDNIPIFGIADFNQRAKFNKFTYRGILNYTTDVGLIYLSYSRGYKSGGINAYQSAPAPIVRPEVLDSLELGAKLSLLDRRLQINAALFHYKYKDIQVQRSDGTSGGGSFAANAAGARINGFELDATLVPVRELTLQAGIGILDSKYTNFPNADVFVPAPSGGIGYVLDRRDLTGASLNQAPKFTGFFTGRYELPIGGDIGKFTLDTTISHNSGFKYDPLGSARQPSYTLVGLGFGWTSRDERITARVSGDNLTNEKYFLFNEIGSQGRRYTPTMPATCRVTLGYKY